MKALVVDIDGTTIDSPKQKVALVRLREAVTNLRLSGLKVCLATGRAETFAMPVVDSLGVTDPMIVSGGSRIIDLISCEQLWGHTIVKEQMSQVLDMFHGSSERFLRNE